MDTSKKNVEEKTTAIANPKICPMMSINRDFYPCTKRCGWYNRYQGGCVMQELCGVLSTSGLITALREYWH